MKKQLGKSSVSFPVTLSYDPESGAILLQRPTDPRFTAEISPGPCKQSEHEALYASLLKALARAGVENLPELNDPRWN